MDYEKERKSASSQERGGITWSGRNRHFGGSGTCKGAHHTKTEKTNMSQFERFVTEGNEKADELAKAGAMLAEGLMAEARAEAMKQEREREEVCVQLCITRPASIAWWRNGKIVKNSSLSRRRNWSFVDKKS